ncbi:hypothetical protein KR009_002240 [Drosophila setifemur]|nr:hypothetical protein KR009_002240 [Drosophila setifemur]
MHVKKFLCVFPLRFGCMVIGCLLGVADFLMGSVALEMVISRSFSEYVIDFFRGMDPSICVGSFALLFYILAFDHFLMVYGAFKDKTIIMGIWLLVNYLLLMFTIATALLSIIGVFRIGKLGYYNRVK